jgi:F0F1-type ATP synthase membrane subunit b/b'
VLERVREETDKLLSEADAKLKAEAVKLRSEIDQSIPALAKQIASKMLNREVQ